MGRHPAIAVASCLAAPFAGVLAAYLLLVFVVIPTVGVGGVQRIIELGEVLDSGFGGQPTAVVIGDSVTVHGVGGEKVEAHAEGWRVLNIGINGCGISEQRVLLPKVLDSGVRAVVLPLRPAGIGRVGDMIDAKLYAYNLGGFPEAFPEWYGPERVAGLSTRAWQALGDERYEAELHFRGAPILVAESYLMGVLVPGREVPQPNNWDEPGALSRTISGSRLERHIAEVTERQEESLEGGERAGAEEMLEMVGQIRDAGVTPVVVVAPIHPAMRGVSEDAYGELLVLMSEMEERYGAVVGDASGLLEADGFADAIHPNAAGRAVFSALIGELLERVGTGSNEAGAR